MTKPLALDLPLQGRQWIEASAGTGKTFTLSLLVLRLLLEREIALPNILAVTFTNAATQELKVKIRDQIRQALDLLGDAALEDVEALEADKRITAHYLLDLMRRNPREHLRQLLASAMQDCDRASIFTIHGFCSRVLGDNALSAGQVLQAPELLTNTVALNEKITFDIWREFSLDRNLMRSLIRLWPTPQLLARQCENLLQAEHLLPEASAAMPEEFDMSVLDGYLCEAVDLHMKDAIALLEEAGEAGIINRVSFKPEMLKAAFDKLSEWRESDNTFLLSDPGFAKLRSDEIKTKQKFHDREPKSPLFDAIELWYRGYEQFREFELARDTYCLHLVRQRLRLRREARLQKQQQYSYDDLISQLVQGLEGESTDDLCRVLRKEYPVALVDEFQDTDSQQWKIFSTLYPERAPENFPEQALYLIGDPKQSIYGFRGGDVHAYLAAKQQSQIHWNLPENFRTRPGLLSAVASLFEQGGDNAFRERDIRFYPVHEGGTVKENDFLLDDKPAPAMQFAVLPASLNQKQETVAMLVPKANETATQACVEKIHQLLTAGQQNRARLVDKKDKKLRGIEPGDIAVLVNQNKQAMQMQDALAACGISSVISSQENLFSTDEAKEVFILLDALIRHQDQARWRGALSTVLLGYHAGQIRQLETDAAAATESADLALQYRELWFNRGVLSLISQLCADASPRLLPLADGERRLSNYLQLAESLQQASVSTLGPEHCLRWLGQAMQDAGSDEENMLRLDSDQQRVKIMTLHKSKGLEFPLVFIPFASFGKPAASTSGAGVSLLNYHDAHRRISHAMLYRDSNGNLAKKIKALAADEQIAEQVRLLYVGLTRAQYYCWVCCGSVSTANTTGFSSLLFRNDNDEIKTPKHPELLQRLHNIARNNPEILVDEISSQKHSLSRFRHETAYTPIVANSPASHLQQDWRVLSFSQLTHGSHHQGPSASPAADEVEMPDNLPPVTEEVFDRRFAGIAFGNALHHALENTRITAWREHDDASTAPASEQVLLNQSLLRQGYSQEELPDGTNQLSPLIFNTLRTRLPEGLRLCDLPENACLNEMEFHFSLRECETGNLLALLKQYGVLQQREEFPFLRRLNGLMTGKIDLIYRHDNRFYVCDYKSNRLSAYDVDTCRQAMRDSEYDFQALIYTLAMHRWCKFRLQSAYNYEKNMGGIRYLFVRGLDADTNNGEGIVAMRFERELIEQLERLLHPLPEQAT